MAAQSSTTSARSHPHRSLAFGASARNRIRDGEVARYVRCSIQISRGPWPDDADAQSNHPSERAGRASGCAHRDRARGPRVHRSTCPLACRLAAHSLRPAGSAAPTHHEESCDVLGSAEEVRPAPGNAIAARASPSTPCLRADERSVAIRESHIRARNARARVASLPQAVDPSCRRGRDRSRGSDRRRAPEPELPHERCRHGQ